MTWLNRCNIFSYADDYIQSTVKHPIHFVPNIFKEKSRFNKTIAVEMDAYYFGLVKDSRIGYSTGLNYPPDWGEHTARLRPGDKKALRPYMFFHMMILGLKSARLSR